MSSASVRAPTSQRRRRGRSAEGGQVLAIFGLSLSVLLGLAGLALDTAHGHGTQLQDQYIADATSISVAHLWKGEAGTTATGPPANPATDAAILAAQRLGDVNKIVTSATPCVVSSVGSGATVDDVVFYGDGTPTPPPPPGSCAVVPPPFKNKVEVSIPPTIPSAQWPTACNSPYWSCVEVTTTQVMPNYLFGILGVPSSTIVATSISSANIPPTLLNPPVPPPFAEMSFEKVTNFKTVNGYPTRGSYGDNCTNCSSHWNTGVETQVLGYDWAIQCAGTAATCDHGVATATAPVIVGSGGRTEYCDTFQANSCTSSTTLGNFGLATQSSVYCATSLGGGAMCDTTLPGAGGTLQEPPAPNYPTGALDGSSWLPPAVSFASVPDCGTLVLNGEPVNDSYLHQGGTPRSGCAATAAEPYVIQPGRYSSIVVNHGRYQFAPGNYDLYGTGAPVNNHQSGWANGIDHSNETAADWDLCTGGTVTSCPKLTASMWIGQGSSGTASLSKGANGAGLTVGMYSPGSYPGCGSISDYQAAGGGDATQVLGRGVYFQFESNNDNPADGFVATHEVHEVSLAAPPLGTSAALSGVPMLFAVEGDFAAVHLDGPGYTGGAAVDNANGFYGLIWTVHKGNTGAGSSHPLGGVEMNPGLAATSVAWTPGNTAGGYRPALYGQIVADSVAYFGSSGTAVDFSNGWGTVLPVANANAQRRIDPFLLEQLYVAPSPTPGYEQVSVLYSGFTAMDGFSSFMTVKGQPVYPSRPVWNYTAAQPPPGNNPGDAHAADPGPSGWTAANSDKDAFTTYTSGTAAAKNVSIGGDFVWGHQGAASPASVLPRGEHAFITYQFPTVPDPTITVSWLLIDGTTSQGGLCGNSTAGTLTFSNVGSTAKGVNLGAPPQVVG